MPARPATAACLLAALIGILPAQAAVTNAAQRRAMEGSVILPDAGGQAMGPARIVRRGLTPDELSSTITLSVTLSMRDFAGLQARVAAGGRVSRQEMEERYLPLRSDYERVSAWLVSQGFKPVLADALHMTAFVKGTVAQAAAMLGVEFARVAGSDGEYTSAISAPLLPEDVAGVVLAVGGLQPQFRLRHTAIRAPVPQDSYAGYVYLTPDNIVTAYQIPKSFTGAGQIIAVFDEAPVASSDLTAFWAAAGVLQAASNVTTITVSDQLTNPAKDDTAETALDVEWAGAIAPAAQMRLYLSKNVLECFTQFVTDTDAYPNMNVVSISYGSTESSSSASSLQQFAQYTAVMAAYGITIVVSSGDAGSNPNTDGSSGFGFYSAGNPLGVNYPASDPSVTGVGGTTVSYSGKWAYGGEVVWDDISSSSSATGGGVSAVFPIPSYQTGGSVLSTQTMRCVPDVAAISDAAVTNVYVGTGYQPATGTIGALTIFNGAPSAYIGTSLSCPVWAGIAALVDQARAALGNAPIGLLNPSLYSLSSTGIFNDVTSGNNGAYYAEPGYDLCTGLGTPNVANLISELEGSATSAPASRLVDISTRAEVGAGANIVDAGFYIAGPAGTTKDILVRGVGPGLAQYGLTGLLAQPVIGVFDSTQALIASNTGWANAIVPGTSTILATYRNTTAIDMASVGAFALTAGSPDSAMVLTLPVGSLYTVEVSGANAQTGVALAEVYELNSSAPQSFVNISARCYVGTAAALAIPGFVIDGTQPMQVLIRGVGPTLAISPYNLQGTLGQPQLSVYDQSSVLIVSNTGWGNPLSPGTSKVAAVYRNATAADMASVGAFALPANSLDSAIVLTLPPGSYTAEVTGVNNTTGTALAEVYEFVSN
jgi:kumamolisin